MLLPPRVANFVLLLQFPRSRILPGRTPHPPIGRLDPVMKAGVHQILWWRSTRASPPTQWGASFNRSRSTCHRIAGSESRSHASKSVRGAIWQYYRKAKQAIRLTHFSTSDAMVNSGPIAWPTPGNPTPPAPPRCRRQRPPLACPPTESTCQWTTPLPPQIGAARCDRT